MSPAIEAFVRWVDGGRDFAQIRVAASGGGHELRHVADAGLAPAELREIGLEGLRGVARHAANGAFRPLKGAPNLAGGWRFRAATADDLELALGHLYPGGLADWFAVEQGMARPMAFRDFAARQTGIYAAVGKLDDATVGDVVRAGCDGRYCLKRRLWAAAGLAEDGVDKGALPCLEPCAVLLEFARRASRLAVEPQRQIALADGEMASVMTALEIAASMPAPAAVREGDLADPANPRRFQLLLGKLRRQLAPVASPDAR